MMEKIRRFLKLVLFLTVWNIYGDEIASLVQRIFIIYRVLFCFCVCFCFVFMFFFVISIYSVIT